ncbi:hypothetical protein AEGHOMDF_3826 [Methylobacterium soli]|nr:hypothetical protein AEGHOMDF_3826 [Methylobacterium soli]
MVGSVDHADLIGIEIGLAVEGIDERNDLLLEGDVGIGTEIGVGLDPHRAVVRFRQVERDLHGVVERDLHGVVEREEIGIVRVTRQERDEVLDREILGRRILEDLRAARLELQLDLLRRGVDLQGEMIRPIDPLEPIGISVRVDQPADEFDDLLLERDRGRVGIIRQRIDGQGRRAMTAEVDRDLQIIGNRQVVGVVPMVVSQAAEMARGVCVMRFMVGGRRRISEGHR